MSFIRRFSLVVAGALLAISGRAEPQSNLGANEKPPELDAAKTIAEYTSPKWQLIWADEFENEGKPNPGKWVYEYGNVRNKEAQFYTRDRLANARVKNGELIITAIKEPWQGSSYTSASISTQGHFSFTYGKVEIRAKIPAGRGVWPALWTLGANKQNSKWPACGEIDMMEYVGFDPELLHFTVHTAAYNHLLKTQKGTHLQVPKPWDAFHRYGLLWTHDRLIWFFDGQPVFSFSNSGNGVEEWPFDAPQYLLMNLAIGGSWGGARGIDETIFPAEFKIDYVRVWQMPK